MQGGIGDQIAELTRERDEWKQKAEARKLAHSAEIEMRKMLQEKLDDLKLEHGKLRTFFDKDGRALMRMYNRAAVLYRELTAAQIMIERVFDELGPGADDAKEECLAEVQAELDDMDMNNRGWEQRGGVGNREEDVPILQQFEAMKTVLGEARALADQADAFDLDWRHECLNLALRAHLALNHESLTWTKEEIADIKRRAEELHKALNWEEDDEEPRTD